MSEDNQIFARGRNTYCHSSEYEDSYEICLDENNYHIINFEGSILNIAVCHSLTAHYIYVLTTNGELFYCYLKFKHNKKFELKFQRLSSNVESIHSYYFDDSQAPSSLFKIHSEKFILVVIDNCVKYVSYDYMIDTQYKTIYNYYEQEFQVTYKTIDLELQNEIQKNNLQIKGCF